MAGRAVKGWRGAWLARPLLVGLLAGASAVGAGAQQLRPPTWNAGVAPSLGPVPGVAVEPAAGRIQGEGDVVQAARPPLLRRPWVRPLASLMVPGSGQLLAGQDRGLLYLVTEAWVVARAISLARLGRVERGQFRDLAFLVARRQFTSRRTDGPFEYYETMSHFVESGVYDVDPGAAFTPEADTTTFNGSMWLLARRTFWEDPDSTPPPTSSAYLAAVAFYQSRAVRPEFRWSWRGARLEQDVFRQTIHDSDEAFRAATNYLGVLVLNHIASAVDALITARLGRRGRGAVPRVGAGSAAGDLTLTWRARL